MKTHKWSDLRKERFTPEQLAEQDRLIEQDLLEIDLRDIRESLGLTQAQVAQAAEMTQGGLARAEGRVDHRVSTIPRIVKALGGEVEIVVKLGGDRSD